MEHIITHHMPPVKSGKSYFLSGDKTEVCSLVTQTIAHPDQRLTHRKDRDKRVYKKKFQCQTGINGKKGTPCYGILAVVKATENSPITAYPI